jgi:amino acid transporter
MGGFSSFALAFSVISVVTGVVSTYGVGLGGGGAGLGLGWPLVCLGTLLVAAAMAELASAFPTAGALYHWSSLLGGRGWGWATATLNVSGQVAIVAAIDVAFAQGIAFELGLRAVFTWPLLLAVVLTHAALNLRSIRAVALANDLSAIVHIVGVVVLAGLLLVFGRVRPIGFLVADGTSGAGGFLSSLLLGMFTMTGFDAAAHASEETHDAARKAPRGIVLSVLVSAVAGYALVVALALATGDTRAAMVDAHPALFVMRSALGNAGGRAAMALALVAMWFCGLSALTGLSRTLFAFARDRGLPRALGEVHAKSGVPRAAVVTAAALSIALVLVVSLGSATGNDDVFVAVASLATTALYVSYALPIALGVRARLSGRWTRRGPWNLGAAGIAVGIGATLWTVFVLVVCSLPPNTSGMFLLVGLVLVITAVWQLWARRRFPGAPTDPSMLS